MKKINAYFSLLISTILTEKNWNQVGPTPMCLTSLVSALANSNDKN